MSKQNEKAPKSCKSCENWKEVKKRMRVGDVLAGVILKMETNLAATDFKASLGDYLKLVQIEKEMGDNEPTEIKVTWVQPDEQLEEPSTDE